MTDSDSVGLAWHPRFWIFTSSRVRPVLLFKRLLLVARTRVTSQSSRNHLQCPSQSGLLSLALNAHDLVSKFSASQVQPALVCCCREFCSLLSKLLTVHGALHPGSCRHQDSDVICASSHGQIIELDEKGGNDAFKILITLMFTWVFLEIDNVNQFN